MFDDDHELQLYEDFLKIAREHPRSKAPHYIRELWEHKGEPINATRLYTLYNAHFRPYLEEDLRQIGLLMQCIHICDFPEMPIPSMDRQALSEVTAFRKRVCISLDRARAENDYARIDQCLDTLHRIEECIIDCFFNNGKSRCLDDITRDHVRLIMQGITLFLKTIQSVHPILVDHIDSHVVISRECHWSLNHVRHYRG